MRTRGLWSLGLAVVLAGLSVILARSWMQSQVRPAAAVDDGPRVETAKIVVAAAPLGFGHQIREDDLRLVDWPTGAVPGGAFASAEQLLGKGASGSRVVLRAIEKDEPVLRAKITGFGARPGLSTLISPAMRAATIGVDDVNGVAGFVLPGDRVDVLLTRDGSGGRRRSELVTDILLQNVRVLGIDQDADKDRNQPGVAKAVTLEVTPVEAQKLTLARKLGTLSLALRHVNAPDADSPATVTVRDLKAGLSAVAGQLEPLVNKAVAASKRALSGAAPKAKPGLASVRIVRGIEASEYQVRVEEPVGTVPASRAPAPSGLGQRPDVIVPPGSAADRLERSPGRATEGKPGGDAGSGRGVTVIPAPLGEPISLIESNPWSPPGRMRATGRFEAGVPAPRPH